MTVHQRITHPEYVEGCYACRISSVTITGCTPTRSDGAGRSDRTAQKRWDRELDLYKSARAQGIQPKSTKTRDIRASLDASDRAGKAWDAGTNTFTTKGV